MDVGYVDMKVSESTITIISILIDSMSRKTCGGEFTVFTNAVMK